LKPTAAMPGLDLRNPDLRDSWGNLTFAVAIWAVWARFAIFTDCVVSWSGIGDRVFPLIILERCDG